MMTGDCLQCFDLVAPIDNYTMTINVKTCQSTACPANCLVCEHKFGLPALQCVLPKPGFFITPQGAIQSS